MFIIESINISSILDNNEFLITTDYIKLFIIVNAPIIKTWCKEFGLTFLPIQLSHSFVNTYKLIISNQRKY